MKLNKNQVIETEIHAQNEERVSAGFNLTVGRLMAKVMNQNIVGLLKQNEKILNLNNHAGVSAARKSRP